MNTVKNNLLSENKERRIPNNYDSYQDLLNSCVMVRLNKILSFVRKNQVVLDLGCGVGWQTKLISLYCKKIFGVDISKEAIDYAKKYNGSVNTYWICNKMSDLSMFSNNTIDLIVSIAAIEHQTKEDMIVCMNESARVLKKGGFFVGTCSKLHDLSKEKVTDWHLFEPSFDDIKKMVSLSFEIKELYNFTINTSDISKECMEGFFLFERK